ncbi:hypothetical protein BOX15_Mlig011474g2 [Macrostomum lignano]|uniref:Uncharacterized protein n=2 Tax=Macrostomum lignano TaxID=282301 RepID=A0A267DJL6_9PLAT|nr:hypothetical protein BOX15_Mlig011474g1 [Macrostomum lignano]PAA66833.1 hypothetical protein BOX15_Mlig005090g1 [Macrostomum lignano]PAA82551.1 hypothetical protein BOX15_Mlig011474g2 [Macrostomum lignano]
MSRNYPADIAAQKSLEERYTKETDSQLHWYMKKKAERERLAAEQGGQPVEHKSRQMEVFRKKLEMAPTMTEELREQVDKFKSQKHLKPKRDENQEVLDAIDRLQGDSQELCVEMRPISPKTKQLLYEGFSREGKGRRQYLKQRTDKAPEDKFQFPIVSSWEYGWKLGDVIKIEDIKKPPFGRTRLINDTFYTRTGVPSKQGEGTMSRSKTVF